MGLLSRLKAEGEALVVGAEGMAMSAEHFLGTLESEFAAKAAPYLAKVRVAFVDEAGYLAKTAWNDIDATITAAVKSLKPQFSGDPIGLIVAVFQAVKKGLPGEASMLEQLALHGLVTMAVSAIAI